MELVNHALMIALSAEAKTYALDVLTEKFYKEALVNLSVLTALLLLMEYAQPARTQDAKNARLV
jgi:hypothetical protein